MRKGNKGSKEQEEENAQILKGFVASEDPELIYELTDILGKGSHGVVYKAINRLNGSIAAVKKLPSILQSDNFASSCREIKILKELSSPYCLDFYDSYLKNGDLWIAMEYFDLGSLGDLLAARKKGFSEYQIQMIIMQVLQGLEYLHSLNLIHRDIKAGNILLNKKGQVKLADFGISVVLDADETRRKTQIGSPFWMSPELILGEGYTLKTDIWSLGITILEMTEVNHPFFEQNPLTAVFQIVSERPPQFLGQHWSQNIRNFLNACLIKSASERPTATELLKHPFLSCGDNATDDIQPGPDDNAKIPLAAIDAMTVPDTPSTESTDDEDDADQLAQPKKRTLREQEMRTTNLLLAQEHLDLIKNNGPKIQSETLMPEETAEAIVRVYLHDRTYKSVRVTVESTAEDVSKTLRLKLGSAWSAYYALYKFQKENERLVEPDTRVLEVMKNHTTHDGPLIWIFKETPDTEAFGDLVELTSKWQPDSISMQTNRESVEKFVRLLLRTRLSVVSALLSIARAQEKKRQEKLVSALVKLFGNANQLVPLFARFGALEVARTMSANNLFVEGSMAARLVSAYGKIAGHNYLRTILSPILRRVYHIPEPLELDPSRLEPNSEAAIHSNMKNLMMLALMIFDSIFENISALPLVFRTACAKLHEVVSSCFPSSGASHFVLRSFLFVKFICPAIVSPDAFGLTDAALSRAAGRTLVLLSKIVAAIVTGTRFGKREPYMAPLNEFVQQQSNSEDLKKFMDTILNVSVSSPPPRCTRRNIPVGSLLSLPPSPKQRSESVLEANPCSPLRERARCLTSARSSMRSGAAIPQKSLPPTPLATSPSSTPTPPANSNTEGEHNATPIVGSPASAPLQNEAESAERLAKETHELLSASPSTLSSASIHSSDDIILSDEQIEEAVKIIHSFMDDDEKFRALGVAMNVLPSPPWDPALEDASDPATMYTLGGNTAPSTEGEKEDTKTTKRRSLRLTFWNKKLSKEGK